MDSMGNSNAVRAHLSLVPDVSRSLADAPGALPESWDDRRSSIRHTLSELSWLTQVRMKYGPAVSLIDLSTGGAQIETTHYRLQPGSTVVVQLAAQSSTFVLPSQVLRSQVCKIVPTGATYRAALAFKRRLELRELPEAKQSNRDIHLANELAKLEVALRRLDESCAGGAARAVATGVGRGALSAALAIIESPSGRGGTGTFTREMGRLFRIITSGLSNETAPRAILDLMIEGMRRAVPAQAIRVVDGFSLFGIPVEATCFDVPSRTGGCTARLVVECPRGCRLDAEHVSFLKAAAHLVSLVAEIEGMMASRARVPRGEPTSDLPAGWMRLVVRYLDGRLLKGFTTHFPASKAHVHVWTVPNADDASRMTIPTEQLKAIFFVHDLQGDLPPRSGVDTSTGRGRRIEITFVDGEVLDGTTLNYSQEGRGFFVKPLDTRGNNVRIFVAPGAVRHVRFP
jgi:hypothetical protein